MRVRGYMACGGVATILLIAPLLSACGKPTTEVQVGPPTADLLSQAAAKTRGAHTGKFEGEASLAVSGGFGSSGSGDGSLDMRIGVSGAYDLEKRQQHVLANLLEYHETTDSKSPSSSIPQVGDQFEEVVDGDTYYEKEIDSGTVKLTDGKPWKKRKVSSSTGDVMGSMLGLGMGVGNTMVDPGQLLDQVTAVSDDVSDLGEETVREATTRHLHASVSMAKLMDQTEKKSPGTSMPGGFESNYRECERKAYSGVSFPVDVFVDGDGYVRRVSVTMTFDDVFKPLEDCMGAPGTTPSSRDTFSMHTSQSVDFFDIGRPVTITVPDPSDVTDGSYHAVACAIDGTAGTTTTTCPDSMSSGGGMSTGGTMPAGGGSGGGRSGGGSTGSRTTTGTMRPLPPPSSTITTTTIATSTTSGAAPG